MRPAADVSMARSPDWAAARLPAIELVGNIPTETILTTLAARGVSTGIDTKSLAIACAMTGELREKYTYVPEAAKPTRHSAKL